jgi:hypothetical protein
MIDKLHKLHECWNRLTGQELKYRPCERTLYELVNNDFTEADLEAVLTFMIHQNKRREPQFRTHLLFYKVCELEYFNSVAGEAVAWQRNRIKAKPANVRVLESFRGSAEPVAEAKPRHISEVFKAI